MAGLPETVPTTKAARRYLAEVREPLMLSQDAIRQALPEIVRQELVKDLGLVEVSA